jgi:hypothetical protein
VAVTEAELRRIFAEAVREVTGRRSVPEIEVGFYPFAGLNSYIRLRSNRLSVKLSDILREAPRRVHQALAHILVAKLFRRKVKDEFERIYRAYTADPTVLRAAEQARRQRGRKRILGPQGRYRNLEHAFQRLNQRYFGGALPMPILTWSPYRSRTVLGHLDHTHRTLVISRLLDDPRIPEFFFEYVLFHEMLHLVYPPRTINGKRYYHTAAFREAEKRFKEYEKAKALAERIANGRFHRR